MSVGVHGEIKEEQVLVDTTVQEKNITYPTDGKLAIKIINILNKIAKVEGIKQRRTYVREVKEHRIKLRFFRHPKKRQKAKVSMKRLRKIAGILLRELQRELSEEVLKKYEDRFEIYKTKEI